METADGHKRWRMIPILPVVGNHDVKGLSLDPLKYDPMFYDIFALPESRVPFRSVNFGDYLSLFLLDTGHNYLIESEQADWLKKALGARENASYKMAVYHVGAYPSVYPYNGLIPQQIRETWCPIFERYRLNAAFEHHSHAYKRTYPIKNEAIDPNGVIYLGDGSWGVSPRKVKNRNMWYLARGESENAVCVITLNQDRALIEALSIYGEVIDAVITRPASNLVSFNETRLLR